MKKVFKTMAFTLLGLVLSVNLMADEATITFANQTSGTGDASTAYTTSDFVSSGIASSDDAFGTITCSETTKCYSGKIGYGLKAGASGKAGSFTISFTALSNVTKITLNAASYSASNKPCDITLKTGETQIGNKYTTSKNSADFANAEFTPASTITSLSTLTVNTSTYCYIKSITITYSAGSQKTALDQVTLNDVSNLSATGVTLNWTGISDSELEGYKVEYKKNSESTWTVAEAMTSSTSSTLSGLTPSTTYDYRITSVAKSTSATKKDSDPKASTFTTVAPQKYYAHFYVNGTENETFKQYLAEGAAINMPTEVDAPSTCSDKVFMGWVDESKKDYVSEDVAPSYISNPVMGSSNVNFYAVFADENEGGGTTSITKDIIAEAEITSSKTLNATAYQIGDLPIQLTATQGTTNWPVINYNPTTGKDLRFYKASSSVTIATTNNQPITKIEFKKNESTNSDLKTYFSANVGTLSGNVWAGSSTSVTITFSNTSDNYKEQMYIVNVTYTTTASKTYSNYTTQCTKPTHTITAAVNDGNMGELGMYTNDGELTELTSGEPYEEEFEILFSADAKSGYEFYEWTITPTNENFVPDGDSPSMGVLTVGESDVIVTASFRPITTKIAAYIDYESTQGSATINGDDTGVEVAEGDLVTLEADPKTGYKFKNWTAEPAVVSFADASSATTTFNMPGEEVIITANFEAKTSYTIKWYANGTELTNGDFTKSLYEGDAITDLPTITETCDPAIQVVGWTKNETYSNKSAAPSDMFSAAVNAPEIKENTTFYAVYAAVNEQAASWTKSSLASMTTSDIFVIEAASYALPNTTATSSPTATEITLSEDEESITSEVSDGLKWYFSGNSTDGYTFHAYGAEPDRWLYSNTITEKSNNTSIRVGAPTSGNNRNKWIVEDGTSEVTYLATKDDYTKRYLSMYNNTDWRGYVNTDNGNVNISFFKYNAPVSETTDYSTTCAAPVTIATPVFVTESKTYTEATTIKFNAVAENVDIYYNINTDARPTTSDSKYDKTNGIVLDANGTYVIRAIAADANGNESEDFAYRSFTIQLPFASIEALQADAETNKSEHEVAVTFNNWIVTAVSGSSNVYFEDATGKGILLYQSSNGFAVGDQISGTLTGVKNLLYNGAAELKNFKKTTTGLTVTSGQTVPVFTPTISEIDKSNQGAVVKLSNVTYYLGTNVLSDGTNTIVPYNKFYNEMSLSDGAKYNITGVVLAYYSNSTITMEIAPRNAGDVEIILNKLDAPENVKVKEGTITKNSATIQWDAVANASSYAISINDEALQNVGNGTSYEITGLSSATNYSVTVTAIGDQVTYSNSDASEAVAFKTADPAAFYTVAYSVELGNVVAGAPEQVEEAGTITMPDVENVVCAADYTFIGWTLNKDYASSNTKPTDLKAAGETSAAINNNITFYAVYGLERVVSTTFADFVDDNTMTSADFVIAGKIKQDDESYKYFALANTGSDKKPTGIDITKNGEVDADKLAANKLTFEKSTTEAGYYSISLNTNPIKYFGWSSSTDFGSSTTVTDNYLWSVSEGKYGTYRIINKGSSSRAIVYRTGTQNCFGPYSTSNINGTEYFDVEVLPVPTQVGTYSLNPDCREERALELESSNGMNLTLDATTDQVSTTISAKANTGSEGALTLSCSQEGASILGTTVTFSKAGTYTIKANQEETTTYAAVKASIEIMVANATITIAYDGNGATEGVPTAAQIEKGSKLTVDGGADLVNGEKTFVNWKDNDNNYYTPGEEYTFTASVTLVAQWADKTEYTITYTAGEGQLIGGKTEPTPAEFAPAAEATVASNEWYEKNGYHFLGWECNGQRYMPNTTFSMPAEDLTMVAQWEQNGEVNGDLVVLVAPYTTYENVIEYYALQASGDNAMKPLQISGVDDNNKAKVGPANQANVSWYKMNVVGGVIFRNAAGEYLTGGGNTTLSKGVNTFVWSWNEEKACYAYSGRTPLYRNTGVFGNYSANNIKTSGYSDVLIIAEGFAPIDYERTDLVVGNYGTVCVPFDVKVADRFGATFWSIESSNAIGLPNPTSITIVQEEDKLEAGKPYIFCAEGTTMAMFFSGEEYKLEDHEDATVPANGLYGNLTDGTITINPTTYEPGFFFVLQQKLYECGVNCTVGVNRGWVKAADIQNMTTPSPAPRRVIGNPNGTPTGINNLNVDGWVDLQGAHKYFQNNHIVIVNEGRIYNAQGILIQ